MPIVENRIQISIEKILFATDFLQTSQKALGYVKRLAQHYGSAVRAVHVIDLSGATIHPIPTMAVSFSSARELGERELRQVRRELSLAGIVENATLITAGNPARAILDVAREEKPDLIALGAAGARSVERFFLGSTAEEIVRNADCPVFTVGPNCPGPKSKGLNFERILYATDLSPDSSQEALYALSLAQESGAHITLYGVLAPGARGSEEQDRILREMLEKFIPDTAREWCTPVCAIEHGRAAEQILATADEMHADLILLGAHPASSLVSHFKAGVAYAVIAGARCPVITIRSRKRSGQRAETQVAALSKD